MYYTYVLQSKKDGKWYTGATENLRKRLIDHNSNQVRATKGRGPFSVIYYEACVNKHDAFAREIYLKSGMGKRYLKNRLKRFLFLTGQGKKGVHPVRGRLPVATSSSNRGYIALISVIIISLLLITISVAVSFSGFFSRFSVLDNEYKEISNGLADACANTAILKVAGDWSYATTAPETIAVGANSCQIVSIQNLGLQKVIRTQAIYQKSFTNLKITVSNSINIDSWEELATSALP
jgi:putative endonuclease